MEQNSDNKYGVAIDIGASKVSVFVGIDCGNNGIKIIAGSTQPIKVGSVKRGEVLIVGEVCESLKKALLTIEKEDGIKINRATLAISSLYTENEIKEESNYIQYTDEISELDVCNLLKRVHHSTPKDGYSLLDILPMGYSVDGKREVDNPIGASGKKLEGKFNVIYSDDSKLEVLKRAIVRSGIEVIDMIPFSIAASEAVLTNEDKELGVCVVDLGATTTEIAIYKDRKLKYTAVLPYGQSLINADIKTYSVLERHVEDLKVQYGSAMPDFVPDNVAIEITSFNSSKLKTIPQRTVARIIEARMIEIIKGIKDAVRSSGFINEIAEGIVLTGGGANLQHISKLFSKTLNISTRVGIPDVKIVGIGNDFIYDPAYSVIIGTLLRSIEKGEDLDIDFIKNDELSNYVDVDAKKDEVINPIQFSDEDGAGDEGENEGDADDEDDNSSSKKVEKPVVNSKSNNIWSKLSLSKMLDKLTQDE